MSKLREISIKVSLCGLSLFLLAGCVGTSETTSAPTEKPSTTTPVAEMTQKQRFVTAIEHLEYGRVAQATEMLNAYLAITPKSRNARELLKQITTSPEDYFPSEFFTVKLESGESLSTLSREYLGSALKFFALAKYNNITNPSRVNVGQSINVPLTAKAKNVLAKESGAKEEKTVEPEIASAEPEEVKPPTPSVEMTEVSTPETPDIASEAAAKTPIQAPSEQVTADSLISKITSLVAKADFSAAMESLDQLRNFGEFTRDIRDLAISALLGHGNQLKDSDSALASERFTEAAQMQLINGDNVAALGNFSKAAELNPQNDVAMEDKLVLQKEIADKYHREASSAFRRQELDVAIENWNKVLEIDPDHSSAKVYLAQAKELKDRLEKINN